MKKKLLILLDSLKVGGGIERVIASLTGLLSREYELHILTFRDFKNSYSFKGKYYSLRENLRNDYKLLKQFKIYSLVRIKTLFKFIQNISPDIIISNMYYTDIFITLTKFLFQIKIPLIIAIHTNPKVKFKKKFILNFLLKLVYSSKYVNKIVVVSKELQNVLQHNYYIKYGKLSTIYNGIDLENINTLKNEKILEYNEIFYNKSIFKFINIGRLVKIKGHEYLIKAFSKVKDEIINSKLIIRGDGPLREELNLLVKTLNLENHIIFLKKKRNIYKYLAKSDIFILSSLYEGLPTVLIEALACGIPIISTNCQTGPKEILDNGKFGILVKTVNTEELAEKMIFLAKDANTRKRFSLMALKRAEFFDLRKTLNQWNKILYNIN